MTENLKNKMVINSKNFELKCNLCKSDSIIFSAYVDSGGSSNNYVVVEIRCEKCENKERFESLTE